MVERVRIVIEALKVKGGDVEVAEQFVDAVSDISETTDANSYWAAVGAAVTNWAQKTMRRQALDQSVYSWR